MIKKKGGGGNILKKLKKKKKKGSNIGSCPQVPVGKIRNWASMHIDRYFYCNKEKGTGIFALQQATRDPHFHSMTKGVRFIFDSSLSTIRHISEQLGHITDKIGHIFKHRIPGSYNV
jgi:hypothetical protein